MVADCEFKVRKQWWDYVEDGLALDQEILTSIGGGTDHRPSGLWNQLVTLQLALGFTGNFRTSNKRLCDSMVANQAEGSAGEKGKGKQIEKRQGHGKGLGEE